MSPSSLSHRLTAALVDLIEIAPVDRGEAFRQQLELLHEAVGAER